MTDWRGTLAHTEAGTVRLLATMAALTEDDLRGPSRLPGWSRAHVATHIARNADSLSRLLEWARTGKEIPQYDSLESRDADIETGATRPAAELAADVRESAERFAARARALPAAAWEATVRAMIGYEHPAWYTVRRRWREVEAHHADLDAGYSPEDWPEPYVRWDLAETLTALREEGALPAGRVRATDMEIDVLFGDGPAIGGTVSGGTEGDDTEAGGLVIGGTGRELLGWLSGRTDGAGLTGGPLPPVPSWPRPMPAREGTS